MNKEQLTIAKVADKIRKYEKTGEVCASNFLDPSEIVDAQVIARKYLSFFCGGYLNSERKILIIGSDNQEDAKDFLDLLTIEIKKANKKYLNKELNNKNTKKGTVETETNVFSHRDILGSILGLGINRDVIGDILIKGNRADVFVIKDISKYIIQNLEKIGREKVEVYKNSFDNLIEIEDVSKEIKTTVASLRLDAMISAATGLSREVSAKMIQNEKVKLNHKIIVNTSKQLKIGDKISVRGYGRIELIEILGETRKDRIRVILKKNS